MATASITISDCGYTKLIVMRKVIWVGGSIPEGMDKHTYHNSITNLAKCIGSEVVKFGEDSFIIIGDLRAEAKMKELRKQKTEMEILNKRL